MICLVRHGKPRCIKPLSRQKRSAACEQCDFFTLLIAPFSFVVGEVGAVTEMDSGSFSLRCRRQPCRQLVSEHPSHAVVALKSDPLYPLLALLVYRAQSTGPPGQGLSQDLSSRQRSLFLFGCYQKFLLYFCTEENQKGQAP